MATIQPLPPLKRRKLTDPNTISNVDKERTIRIQFVEEATGLKTGQTVLVSVANTSQKDLTLLLNTLVGNDHVSYTFTRAASNPLEEEDAGVVVEFKWEPKALFRVKCPTRSGAVMNAGSMPVICTHFSPETSSRLVTGSGDNSARIWDCDTATPYKRLNGHSLPINEVRWSPDGSLIATASRDKTVRLWDPITGEAKGGPMVGHSDWITAIAWEPYHLSTKPRLASASRDATVRVWNSVLRRIEAVLSGHSKAVLDVKWGGEGLIYTSSQDQTIKIWDADSGTLYHTLKGHSHWVTQLALSTAHALRTSYFDTSSSKMLDESSKQERAKTLYQSASKGKAERLVSASDDTTLCLWNYSEKKTPVCKMHGHQKVVLRVEFSPNGALIASASFDNQIKLWNGRDGSFLATLKGHVHDVYQLSFSADSRLLASGSKDTTVKVWDIQTRKLKQDLPGHRAEVLAVDWSPDGDKIASASRDGKVRLWTF